MPKFLQNEGAFLLQATLVVAVAFGVAYGLGFTKLFSVKYDAAAAGAFATSTGSSPSVASAPVVPALDTADYDHRMWLLANNGSSTAAKVAELLWLGQSTTTALAAATTSPLSATSSAKILAAANKFVWPIKTVYPNAGAILPFHRIIAYYGNFYSKGMGVLGQYPEDIMLSKLADEVAKWNAADPSTPAIPAINYIAVTAQGSPGAGGKYRLRMPDDQIDHALELADKMHGIVILDVQVGKSTLQSELPALEKYLSMPNVHLGIDPEFSMKTGDKPGDVIGTFSSADVNYAVGYLAGLVRANNLPPKVLVIHRFTQGMVTGVKNIKPLPEVEIVMDMDGWGSPAKKLGTYQHFIQAEPVQFTGFKLFYKNDLKAPSTRLLTPTDLLKLTPKPVFIQFQ